jgi:hypothetical protein
MTTPATTEADTDPVRAAILTAIDRLVEGTPQRSEGRLSVSHLAVEADVKRWHLTHQHTDVTGPRLLPAPQRPSSRAQ